MKNWVLGLTGLVALAVVTVVGYGPWPVNFLVALAVVVLFGLGWQQFLRLSERRTSTALIVLIGVLALLMVLVSPGPFYMTGVAVVVAAGLCSVFIVQMVHQGPRSRRLERTFGLSSGVILVVCTSGWFGLSRLATGSEMLAITGSASVIVLLLGMLSWPDRIVAPLGLILGGLAAPLAARLFSDMHTIEAMGIGVVVSATLLGFRRLATVARPQGWRAGISFALAPMLTLGAVSYVLNASLVF